jgi:hypothetical protein
MKAKDFLPERILSYVVASDRGLAPNVSGGTCTLSVCKPVVRQSARPGKDWIVGMSTSAHGRHRVIYAMQVQEKISYDTFFHDARFKYKKPGTDREGDNFFVLKNGVYRVAFNDAAHAGKPVKIARDIKSPVSVIGGKFWYFGSEAPELPQSLWDTPIAIPGDAGRRGHRVTDDKKTMAEFVKWIEDFKPGIHGRPRDLEAARPAGARAKLEA